MENTIIEKEDHKWYALYVTPNSEKKIKNSILREIKKNKLEDYVINIEVPTEKYWTIIKNKKTLREKVMIPGYILVRANLKNGEVVPTLKGIKGVFNFVTIEKNSPNKKPTPLSKKEVDRFLNNADEGEREVKYNYEVGDKVEILQGAFKTFSGHIDTKDDGSKKMRVIVNIFNREVPVELEYHQVKTI